METFVRIIGSEFLWGTVLGAILAIISSLASVRFQARTQENTQRNRVKAFIKDLIFNISEFTDRLEDNRDRSKVIHLEFLDLIQSEIQIYGRNREHIILIEETNVRSSVRDYFSKAAVQTVKVKSHLEQFDRFWNISQTATNAEDDRTQASKIADQKLLDAHKACDRLRELKALGAQIASSL